jgi:hypothetical protein
MQWLSALSLGTGHWAQSIYMFRKQGSHILFPICHARTQPHVRLRGVLITAASVAGCSLWIDRALNALATARVLVCHGHTILSTRLVSVLFSNVTSTSFCTTRKLNRHSSVIANRLQVHGSCSPSSICLPPDVSEVDDKPEPEPVPQRLHVTSPPQGRWRR